MTGRYRWLFLVPQPALCSSCHGSFLGDGSDAATTGDQTLAISRLDLVPSCRLLILFLGPQMVAGGETEAGQASGLPQGPQNPASGSLSLTQGTHPVEQDWPRAQYALPPGKAQWRANTVCGPAGSGSPARLIPWVVVVSLLPPLLGQDHQGLGLGLRGGTVCGHCGPQLCHKVALFQMR